MQKTVNELKFIKQYYKPIQPTVSANGNDIFYQEIRPNKFIENFVYCFWQLKTRYTLNQDYCYRVVSDGCIDIFFDHKHPNDNFVMGFCQKYVQFPIGKDFDYIGIRFLPTAFPHLFGINAKTLSNKSEELNKVTPGFSNLINTRISSSDSFESIAQVLNQQIVEILKTRTIRYDQRF